MQVPKASRRIRTGVYHAAELCGTIIHSVFRGAPVSSALLTNTAKSPDRIRWRAPVAQRRSSATPGAVFRNGDTRRRLNNEIEF
jgi:hypothetical protein